MHRELQRDDPVLAAFIDVARDLRGDDRTGDRVDRGDLRREPVGAALVNDQQRRPHARHRQLQSGEEAGKREEEGAGKTKNL